MSTLSLAEIRHNIPAYYTASVEPGGPSYHIEGPPGGGKTSLMETFPDIMSEIDPGGKWAMAYINGASVTTPWLAGFMQLISSLTNGTLESNGHNEQLMRSVFSLPFWWFLKNGNPISAYDGGIIFVDEYDKMGLDEKKIAADMRLKGQVANHVLPDGWVVWSAGNRAGIDRSGSTKDFDFEINRRIVVSVRPDAVGWGEHCRAKTKVLPEVISFGESQPQLLYQERPTIQGPWCTPRSLCQADSHIRANMKVFGHKKIPLHSIMQTEVQGGIGKEAAEALFLHIRLGQELPSYDDVISTPESIEIPTEIDRLRLLSYKIGDAAKPQDAGALVKFMARLPKEFQVMLFKMAGDRNKMVIVRPEIRDWARQHMHLVALIDNFDKRHKQAAE